MMLDIDDELIQDVMEYSDKNLSPTNTVQEALTTFIRMQALKNLVALGGGAPNMRDIPR